MTKLEKIREAILGISKKEIEATKGSSVPVRLENGTTLNDKKWRNMSVWAGCKREEVAVYIDDTLMASCKKGGAFTEEAFWHTDLLTKIPKKAEKRFSPLRYADVRGVKWNEEKASRLTIVFDDGEVEVYGSIYAKFYAAALEKAVTVAGYQLGAGKPAKKKAASKKKAAEPKKLDLSGLEYLDTLGLGTNDAGTIVAKIAKDYQDRLNAEREAAERNAAAEAQAAPAEQGYAKRIDALERELAELRAKAAAEEAAAKKAAEEAVAKKAAEKAAAKKAAEEAAAKKAAKKATEEAKRKAETRTTATAEEEALLEQIYKTQNVARLSQPEVVEIIKLVSMEGRTAASRGDYALAKRKFKLTAQLGVKQDVYNMALVCYKMGELDEAAAWADRSVNNGHEKAAKLKERIENARIDQWMEDAEKDPAESFRKMQGAANAGNVYAMSNLVVMYGDGKGVAKDMGQAFRWTRQAALAAHVPAYYALLAELYANGDGTEQNYEAAAYWARKAVEYQETSAEPIYKELDELYRAFFARQEVGDRFAFGRYPQTEDGGVEPIVWRVLDKQKDKILVLSEKILDSEAFNDGSGIDGKNKVWAECMLRQWLHNEFWNRAFEEADTTRILQTTIKTTTHPDYDWMVKSLPRDAKMPERATVECPDTVDRLFLLSWEEVIQYLADGKTPILHRTSYFYWYDFDSSGTVAAITPYANQRRGLKSMAYERAGIGSWWLRTVGPGKKPMYIESGDVAETIWKLRSKADEERGLEFPKPGGSIMYNIGGGKFGVRPAMWLSLK